MGRSPRCYVPSFDEIGTPVLVKKNFEEFLSYMGTVAICHQIFNFLHLKAFMQNLAQNGMVVFEKIWFDILYVHDFGPRARNDLDLQYSHTYINLIRYLPLPTFRSLAAIVSEKFTVSLFLWKSPNYKI